MTKEIHATPFGKNPAIFNEIAFTLLPRWFGNPGDSEAYRDSLCDSIGGVEGDILYSQLSVHLYDSAQRTGPFSKSLNVDTTRFMKGVVAYYGQHSDPDLLDGAIFHMGLEGDKEAVDSLFKIRHDKSIGPGLFAIRRSARLSMIEGGVSPSPDR